MYCISVLCCFFALDLAICLHVMTMVELRGPEGPGPLEKPCGPSETLVLKGTRWHLEVQDNDQ